jgi:hypothetical protein
MNTWPVDTRGNGTMAEKEKETKAKKEKKLKGAIIGYRP